MTLSIASRLEFNPSTFLKSLKSIYFPDKKIPIGNALKYIYLEQVTSSEALLVCYIGKGWFSVRLDCVGFIGTSYLFDGQDALDRLSKSLSAIKDSPALQFFQTPNSKMSVNFVFPNSKSKSNIAINTYNNDYSDFTEPWLTNSSLPLSQLTPIPKSSLKYFTSGLRIANSFSSLSSDTFEKPVWLWSLHSSLWLVCTEKSGINGVSLLCLKLYDCTPNTFNVGIVGKQLLKSAYLFFLFNEISLCLNSENQFVIKSDESMAILTTFNPSLYPVYSKGFQNFFIDRSTNNFLCHLTFFLEDLITAVTLCSPKSNDLSNDIVLELSDNHSSFIISKRADATKLEKSEIEVVDIVGSQQWVNVVLSHTYFLQALLALKGNYLREESLEGSPANPSLDFDPDDFEQYSPDSSAPSNSSKKLITLTLDSFREHYVLYISSSSFTNPLTNLDFCATIICRPLQIDSIDDY